MLIHLYSQITKYNYICYDINLITSLTNYEEQLFMKLLLSDCKHSITKNIDISYKYKIGPKKGFKTTWCTNFLQILNKININKIISIEKCNIYSVYCEPYDTMIYCNYLDNMITKPNILTKYCDIDKLEHLDYVEYSYYKYLYKNKKITNVEITDILQSNSEHSRHWFFNGKYNICKNNKELYGEHLSLLDKIKFTNARKSNSVIAFSDNSSAIQGKKIYIYKSKKNFVYKSYSHLLPTHTAETHNFPTCISPFSGANTGVGGRIRDTICLGKGSKMISGYCGYCVGNINNENMLNYPYKSPKDLLIEASNGVSDYGNKIGEPLILGFTRSFSSIIENTHYEYIKPILYCGGIGSVLKSNLYKKESEFGDIITQIGGPAYKIGFGGGAASSNNQTNKNKKNDFNAVQRGDPFMANKLCRFIETCSNMEEANPILNIHDQGSGGMGNVTKELVEPNGAYVELTNVNLGDKNMTSSEIWSSEYQEQCSFLTNPKHFNTLKKIAKIENIPIRFVGIVNNKKNVNVSNKNDSIYNVANFDTSTHLPHKLYNLEQVPELKDTNNSVNLRGRDFKQCLLNVLSDLDVGCKKFLTNKVDRSVSGLVAQQQTIGPFQLPLSDYSITKMSFEGLDGIVCSIGERPYIGLIDVEHMVNMCVGEMLTNIIFSSIEKLENIKLLGNWMWSTNIKGNDYLLYKAVNKLTDTLTNLNIGIDGGKDSLSMNIEYNNHICVSPNSLVLSSYVLTNNVYNKLTPEFKGNNNLIIYIPLSDKFRLGGSILLKTLNLLSMESETPNFENTNIFPKIFKNLQHCLVNNYFEAGHDISDGGIITCLIEMCIASDFGCNINIDNSENIFNYMFNEELGLVYEISYINLYKIEAKLKNVVEFKIIGQTTQDKKFKLTYNNKVIINECKRILLDTWMSKSYELEKKQCNLLCVEDEYKKYDYNIPKYNIKNTINYKHEPLDEYNISSVKPIVLVIRDEGSNGDKELINCFYECDFDVYDININSLLEKKNILLLHQAQGIAFCGGFTYSDTLGSATGWSSVIMNNKELNNLFTSFYNRKNTFSIGICNGCQLMSKLGWVPNCELLENNSERFESRYVNIKVNKSNCIFTKDLEDIVFGMWCAHKEGKFSIGENKVFSYCDNNGFETMLYPYNPNGSINSCAGICSDNGRHLALMPHPERSFYDWQLPWKHDKTINDYTPWKKLFENAHAWALKN